MLLTGVEECLARGDSCYPYITTVPLVLYQNGGLCDHCPASQKHPATILDIRESSLYRKQNVFQNTTLNSYYNFSIAIEFLFI